MPSKVMENVKTVNSVVRTAMMVTIAGGLGYGTWFGYTNYVAPSIEAKQAIVELDTLKQDYERQTARMQSLELENDRLATTLKLLKIEQRVALIEVLEKGVDDRNEEYMLVRFTEVDPDGNPTGPSRDYTLMGKTFFIDTWIAKFEDRYIEQADGLRGVSLFKFKRIFGDDERPSAAQSLDLASGGVPKIYQSPESSAFEEKIWADFDAVCNNRERQEELGIRAIGRQAPSLMAEEGRTYKITIRSTGDINLVPLKQDSIEAQLEP